MWKHCVRVVAAVALPATLVGYLLTHDIPTALEQADRSAVQILSSLGAPNPHRHLATWVFDHPYASLALLVALFGIGVGLSWCVEWAYARWKARLRSLPGDLPIELVPAPEPVTLPEAALESPVVAPTVMSVNQRDRQSAALARVEDFLGALSKDLGGDPVNQWEHVILNEGPGALDHAIINFGGKLPAWTKGIQKLQNDDAAELDIAGLASSLGYLRDEVRDAALPLLPVLPMLTRLAQRDERDAIYIAPSMKAFKECQARLFERAETIRTAAREQRVKIEGFGR